MRLLALDTSTEACSAALLIDGELRERFELAPREHAALILSMVDALLAEAQLSLRSLDALAFGRGPGAFTGVRIGTGVAQGLAFGADLPVVPISTLAALAQGAWRERGAARLLPAIDARMGEIYWACYEARAGLAELLGEEHVSAPERLQAPGSGWFGVGSGWATYGEVLRERLGEALSGVEAGRYPHAQDIAVLGAAAFSRGQAVDAAQALPVYLRDEVAWKKR